jgi:hypothetical protein
MPDLPTEPAKMRSVDSLEQLNSRVGSIIAEINSLSPLDPDGKYSRVLAGSGSVRRQWMCESLATAVADLKAAVNFLSPGGSMYVTAIGTIRRAEELIEVARREREAEVNEYLRNVKRIQLEREGA